MENIKQLMCPPKGTAEYKLLQDKKAEYTRRLTEVGRNWHGMDHDTATAKFPDYRMLIYRIHILESLLKSLEEGRMPVSLNAVASKLKADKNDPCFCDAWEIVSRYVHNGGKDLNHTITHVRIPKPVQAPPTDEELLGIETSTEGSIPMEDSPTMKLVGEDEDPPPLKLTGSS